MPPAAVVRPSSHQSIPRGLRRPFALLLPPVHHFIVEASIRITDAMVAAVSYLRLTLLD
jgi:hypothetical protein